VTAVVLGAAVCTAQDTRLVGDDAGDARIRRTDPDANGPVDPQAHHLPDILSYEIGAWDPNKPDRDLFKGKWDNSADFFRLDIVFEGLINPPGTLGGDYPFNPFKYGDHPLFGYVEIDMDADIDVQQSTGGEYDRGFEPLPKGYSDLRFNGNVARYGGLPTSPRFEDRIALDAFAFDGVLATPPFADRSGEEFHIAFYGWEIDRIEKRSCPGGCGPIFERGNTWVLFGYLFHRAHAYEDFSYAIPDGAYEPEVQIQFDHHQGRDQTTVSIVYPLTNAGSAAMRGEPVEENDNTALNQNSVLEALDELNFSARNATREKREHPDFPIIENWEFRNPADFLDSLAWEVTLLVATSYTLMDPDTLFVWVDHSPDIKTGDFDGNDVVDEADLELCYDYITTNDGVPEVDEDGEVNCRIDLIEFGRNFSLFDVDYDGIVDDEDCPGFDCRVDLADFATFQLCFTGTGGGPIEPGCEPMDFDDDDDVDLDDFEFFVARFIGP